MSEKTKVNLSGDIDNVIKTIAYLEAYGIYFEKTKVKGGVTDIEYTLDIRFPDSLEEVKIARTRNAGPKVKELKLPEGIGIKADDSVQDFLNWAGQINKQAVCKQLGISRFTIYEKIKQAKELACDEEKHTIRDLGFV